MANDYGTLNGRGAQSRTDTIKHGQVYLATHDGEGRSLPFMNRSFISFTFGGRKVEDFNLIATIDGDRINRAGYAEFDDRVSTYDNLDGQYYWATHYKANQLDFTLSTDGIDQKMLDEFLHWFRAGETKELILAEHPNRAILARVSRAPQLNLLPFEQPVTVTLSTVLYQTSTTLYKGDIKLSLTMDEPHWYAIVNILGIKENGRYVDKWHDITTDQDVWIIESKDALKILYEDGIPLGSMIDDSMLLGDGAYAQVNDEVYSFIWTLNETDDNFANGVGARIEPDIDPPKNLGIIAGALVDVSGDGISSLAKDEEGYFFYAGTAPAPTIISFILQPKINSSTYYITTPANKYSNSDVPYNTITITSEHTQTLRFTTPNLYTSYNKTIKIFDDMVNNGYTWEQIRVKIRDDVRHQAVRAWANKIIESFASSLQVTATADTSTIKLYMKYLLCDTSGEVCPVTFSFNSANGVATGTFQYRTMDGNPPASNGNWLSPNNINLTLVTEDVGDMLRSNYIILQDRNYPDIDGNIKRWVNQDGQRHNSHMIKHDCETALTKISILYKNMYL